MKTIVLCGSTVFYDHLAQVADELEALGWKCIVPIDAEGIRQGKAYDATSAKTWYDNPADFYRKGEFMRDHFDKIPLGDAILVVNDRKHGIDGYIGPNVLMEMGLAFHLHKPIYILNPISKELPIYEEAMGMTPKFLDGQLSRLTAEIV